MGVFIKALIKSMTDKKARTALILFSIAVSASLIFANECFSLVCKQKFYEADVRFGGNSDIRILTKESVGAKEWIDPQKLSKYEELFQYNYRFIKEKALYMPDIESMHYFSIIGADIDEFNSYNPLILKNGEPGSWNGFKAIIGTTYAEKYDLRVNDTMKLEMAGKEYTFTVAAISEAKGLFTRELADGGFIIVPKDTLSKIFNGGSNLIFLKLKDSSQKTAIKEKLTEELEDYVVGYGVDDALIAAETANYVMPFKISAVAVVFMSIFIIFSAFNLVTLERIPLIGTLQSIGCSRRRINRLLIAESACLGAAGGLLGCALGIGVLRIIIMIYFSKDVSAVNSDVLFSSRAILTAVAAAVIITTASSIIPILRITKIPIKKIILNDIFKKQSKKSSFWIVGCILMILCVLVPPSLNISFTAMLIGCIISTGALVGMIPLVTFMTFNISRLAEKIPFLKYETVLGIRNLRDNRSLLNNIQLFSAAIAIVAFMSSIFNSMSGDLIKAYERDMNYHIRLVLRNSNENTLNGLKKVKGVEDCIGNYMTDADLPGHNTFLNMVYGINGDSFFTYNSVGRLDATREAVDSLNRGRNIITTNILKDKLGLKQGDMLLIRFGSKEVSYCITGFVETNTGIGHVGYISVDNYKKDAEKTAFTNILIKAEGNPITVKNNIQRAYTRDVMSINTKEELKIANSDKVIPMFNAVSVYSYIALLVGLIGIINNIAASFLERKRSFAMLRSMGMSRKGLSKMLITEAAVMGLYGILFGLITAGVMSFTIPTVVSIFWGKVTVSLPLGQMAVMGLAGMLAMFAISALPVIKGKKLSIMQSLKYE